MVKDSTAARPFLKSQTPMAAPPPPPASLGPTDLDGAMASLDAFHRANGLPPITARGSRVQVSELAAAAPALTFEAQMQAGANAARRLLRPEKMPVAQQATTALATRAKNIEHQNQRAAKAKSDFAAGAEAARKLTGR